ncbi:hypothetical protein AZE42_04282 [Rhizopogon vesiculosus]|uniref:Fanconi-associated nuclease n=1 Tax=Rhizopogon vesiculosus TaxID=180088 RepID=A0A1J8R2M3_9AGAM|nr:hypothetical protein AZE42_04282 [Rhizopogon vesiculosus]
MHVIAFALSGFLQVNTHKTTTQIMSPSSPNATSVSALIFCGGEFEVGRDDPCETQICEGERHEGPSNYDHQSGDTSEKKPNVYVELFEEMLRTLVETEGHLFNLEELDYIWRYAALSPNAKFLMTKLLLRKFNTWHRLDSLKFEAEIGSTEGLIQAIDEICAAPGQVKEDSVDEAQGNAMEEREVINLTFDHNDVYTPSSLPSNTLQSQLYENLAPLMHQIPTAVPSTVKAEDVPISLDTLSAANAIAGPSSMKLEDIPMDDAKPDTNHLDTLPEPTVVLAENESEMDLPTLLECLRVDELRTIVKQMRVVKAGSKKPDMINALLRNSCTQSTLFDFATTKTQPSQSLLLPALLSRFKKRSYASVTSTRTRDIWPTREALLAYEEALEQEGIVDAAFAGDFATGGVKREFRTPATGGLQFKMPATPSTGTGRLQTPMSTTSVQTPSTTVSATPSSTRKGKPQSRSDPKADVSVKVEKSDSVRVRGARIVKEIFEQAYPHWQALVKVKSEDGSAEKVREYGFERFESGYILTRLICKGAYSLGILGEHDYELRVLESLLAQRRWRRGRRGRWYERRALILEKYAARDHEMKWAQRALVACVEALEDDDTHIVYRPKLERRLTALEKKLNLDYADRHTSEGNLLRSVSVSFEGVRVCHRAASLKLDRTGRNTSTSAKPGVITTAGGIAKFLSPVKSDATKADVVSVSVKCEQTSRRKEEKGKSIWIGRDNLEVHVETLALQWYEDQGFKGIHSETRIITTLFGILFWDIIFLPVPGAFETPFQTAPLDIVEDSFYHARRDVIEARLKELEDGRGEDIAKRVEGEHRARNTWCVGVDWSLLEEGEIIEIVRCLGGKALSVICRLFCEDYAGRRSGGPDLFVWNADTGDCKFVEVKGPGDNLQENQKVWIDVLLRAQAAVEVCLVCEKGKGNEANIGKKRKSKENTKPRRGKAKNAFESDTEEEEMQPIYESEDEVDALPVIAPAISDFMEDNQSDIIDPSTARSSSNKRKLVAEVVISTPSPRKRAKFSRRSSSSPEV